MALQERPGLTRAEYDRLREAAPTPRSDLVLRLAGEVGLRPAEMAGLCLSDVRTVAAGGCDHYLVAVGDREAYLPRGVERDLRQYANAAGRDPTDPVFEVSARRLQMLVSEAAEAAAGAGHERLAGVSSGDLRGHFARRWLADGVAPPALLAAGGWSRLDALSKFLPDPDAVDLVAAFAPGDAGADLRAAVATARLVTDRVADATDNAGVREGVRAAVAEGERYRQGWIEPPGDVTPAAGAEVAARREYLAAETPTIHDRARETGAVQTSADAGPGTVAVAPVPRRDGPDETLVVVCDGLAGGEPDLLRTLGGLVGSELASTRQRRRLLSETATRAEFRYEDGPLPALSTAVSGRLTLSGAVPHGNGAVLLFVDVAGATPESVLDAAGETPGLADSRLVADHGESARFEVLVGEGSPLAALIGAGATPVDLDVSGGAAEVTVDLPPDADIRSLLSTARPGSSSLALRSKREVDRSDHDAAERFETLPEELTERQASTLRAAYLAGYFEWPRESTAESLAASLDVSSPTFHQHLRKAQGKLLDAYFETTTGT